MCEVGVLGQESQGGIDVSILLQMTEPRILTRKEDPYCVSGYRGTLVNGISVQLDTNSD